MATVHIESSKYQLSKENVKVQSIPCKIAADCDANVDNYFNKYVKTIEDNTKKASFRGYPLRGKAISIPEGYMGVVLHESIRPSTEKEERKFHIINKFDEITFWNWDKKPSADDSITQALQWIDIAEALHSPVVEE